MTSIFSSIGILTRTPIPRCQRLLRKLAWIPRRPVSGRFQPYNYTLPNRYPWLFEFAAKELGAGASQLLSFGCSRGDEIFALREYFPNAAIRGIDIDARNIAACRARAAEIPGLSFSIAANLEGEDAGFYDAIFCLAVLVHGDLTTKRAQRCDPLLRFWDFERMVRAFSDHLRPGGLLCLHTTNFRLCDTNVAQNFDVLLEAAPEQLAADVKFDRNNQLMPDVQYRPVIFRKRC
jgi:SAM-dependent methyltransferase